MARYHDPMNLASAAPAQGGDPSCHTLRTRLREATADVHARVDARFASGLGTPQAYVHYLQGMQRTLVAFEHAIRGWSADPAWADWVQPGRAALLDEDLRRLGETPLTAAAVPSCDGPGGLLGTLYVIEGSAMGARVLRRGVPADAPAAFLDSHAGAAARWPRLAALLERHPAAGDAAHAACTSALGLFALADDSFRLAAGEPAR